MYSTIKMSYSYSMYNLRIKYCIARDPRFATLARKRSAPNGSRSRKGPVSSHLACAPTFYSIVPSRSPAKPLCSFHLGRSLRTIRLSPALSCLTCLMPVTAMTTPASQSMEAAIVTKSLGPWVAVVVCPNSHVKAFPTCRPICCIKADIS